MNDTIYGAGGLQIGTWSDFWSRYQLPQGITATPETTAPETAQASPALGYVSAGAMGVTAVANIFSAYNSAKTQRALRQINAQMQEINRNIAEKQAQSALRQSEFKIAALTLNAGKVKSAQRVSLSANGVVMGKGTSAELMASTDIMKEIDVKNQRLNGIMSAFGYRFKALGMDAAAAESRMRASASNPWLAASGQMAESVGSMGYQFYGLKKVGLLGG